MGLSMPSPPAACQMRIPEWGSSKLNFEKTQIIERFFLTTGNFAYTMKHYFGFSEPQCMLKRMRGHGKRWVCHALFYWPQGSEIKNPAEKPDNKQRQEELYAREKRSRC
jgi:hypothetical protein